MKKASLIICLSITGLFLSSCFRHSTVVHIQKDGSGKITERTHFSPQMTGMLGGMGAQLGGAEEGAEGGADMDITKPDVSELKEAASKFGEGVTYTSHKEDKNKDGWDGYVVVYSFEDISKVKLSGDTAMPGNMKEMAEKQGQKLDSGSDVTFTMADGTLTINSNMGEDSVGGLTEQMGGGEEMPEGVKPSMMAAMFNGMRMGMFVKVEGGIAKTDATHVENDFITIMDMDMGKMLADKKFLDFIDKSAADPESITEEEVKKLGTEIDGVKVDMQEKITVQFK